jgi:hypothetical protein
MKSKGSTIGQRLQSGSCGNFVLILERNLKLRDFSGGIGSSLRVAVVRLNQDIIKYAQEK